MAKNLKIEYFDIESTENFASLQIKRIKDFVKLAETLKVPHVFKTESDEGFFLFFANQILYKIKRNGYKQLEDYLDAEENEYPTAVEYYEAKQGNFLTYKEYKDCKNSGITDRLAFLKAQKLGFIDKYDEFIAKAKKNPKLLPSNFNIDKFDTAMRLYEYAMYKNFKDYQNFQEATFLGFPDQTLFEEAKSKGFTYADDFLNATRLGFDNIAEYQEAMHLKIENKFEYEMFAKFKKATGPGQATHDEVLFVMEIRKYENGKKLSINKIMELLNEWTDKYRIKINAEGEKSLPAWFSRRIDNKEAMINFITSHKELTEYGIFDKEGEYFEVSRMSNETILVDGSNVAYANNEKETVAKPLYRNIGLLVEKLKQLRFKDIIVIADASLRYKVGDPQNLSPLEKYLTYQEAPAFTTADEFLIEKAKKDHCFIVTNDTFRDWKAKDAWVAENFDKIRIPFMIIDLDVSIPILEQRLSKMNS